MRFWIKNGLIIGLLLELLVLIGSYLESNGATTPLFQAAARWSGRVSLLYFTFIVVFCTLFPRESRTKDAFVLFRNFAILHVIHWFLLATSVYLTGFELVPFRVAGGAIAYVLVVFTPYILQSKLLNEKQWKYWTQFYLFWVWLIFMLTYVARLSGKSPEASGSRQAWIPLAAFTALLMVWRLYYSLLKPKANL